MKTLWKPLDVMGLRLYKVRSFFPTLNERRSSVVAAGSPSEAAKIVRDQYAEMPPEARPECRGEAMSVCQPAEWWNG